MRLAWQPTDLEAARPFWAATAAGELRVPWCTSCDQPVLYPRDFCPACHAPVDEWRTLSGAGTVYSFGVEHRKVPGCDLEPPYVVALVELREGGRLVTNVLDPPEAVAVGTEVQVEFQEIDDGRHVPRFRVRDA